MEHTGVVDNYLEYKEELMAHYNKILGGSPPLSVIMLVEAIMEVENKHKTQLIENKQIEHEQKNFSEMLALTPLHEMQLLSKAFNDIIAFREETYSRRLSNLSDIGEEREIIKAIGVVEESCNLALKLEKSKCHL